MIAYQLLSINQRLTPSDKAILFKFLKPPHLPAQLRCLNVIATQSPMFFPMLTCFPLADLTRYLVWQSLGHLDNYFRKLA